ncbi:MAG: hypothetical protein SPI74_05785 [Eubacterium sp.]|nr:hypothetical protein [Eubacterium sp.]
MNRIVYRSTSIFRQVFLALCLGFVLLRLGIILELIFFKIEKYSQAFNIPLTIVSYVVIIFALLFLFSLHRKFIIEYDDNTISYQNRLTRKTKRLSFSESNYVLMNKKGIYFYKSKSDMSSELLKIPFYRFGFVDAVLTNNLFKKLISDESITVEKQFKILPGHEPVWKLASWVYGVLAVLTFMQYATPIKVFVILLSNH